jgi:hypothetical protein
MEYQITGAVSLDPSMKLIEVWKSWEIPCPSFWELAVYLVTTVLGQPCLA